MTTDGSAQALYRAEKARALQERRISHAQLMAEAKEAFNKMLADAQLARKGGRPRTNPITPAAAAAAAAKAKAAAAAAAAKSAKPAKAPKRHAKAAPAKKGRVAAKAHAKKASHAKSAKRPAAKKHKPSHKAHKR
jgi:hypothetical protein